MYIQKTLDAHQRSSISDYKNTAKMPLIIMLDNLRSAHNVGSIFRTADAFAVQTLVLNGITPCPPHKEILKTALGATDSVDWIHFPTNQLAVDHYRRLGYDFWAVEQTTQSTSVQNVRLWEWSQPIVLILGNEVRGVSAELLAICQGALEIPQMGTKHSLNVSVCAGIVIWECHNAFLGKSQ